jgi:hypothetical protein
LRLFRPSYYCRIGIRFFVLVCLFIIALEVLFRIAPPKGLRHFLENTPTGGALVQPHPYLGYALTPGWQRRGVHHNRLGFRGRETSLEKPKGTVRIVCLGGSTTYGFFVTSDDETWPARLEVYLREIAPGHSIEVINAGVPGYTSFESLTSLQFRVLDLQPDIIVVYQGYNDLRAATWPNPRPDNTHFRKSWTGPALAPSTLESSSLFLLLRGYWNGASGDGRELATYVIVPVNGDRIPNRPLKTINPQAINNYERNVRSLVSVALIHGSRVLLAPEAYGELTIDPEISDVVGDGMFMLAERMRQITSQHANDQRVGLLDAPRSLPLARGVFADGVHLTKFGADRFAWLVAGRLKALKWIPVSG